MESLLKFKEKIEFSGQSWEEFKENYAKSVGIENIFEGWT